MMRRYGLPYLLYLLLACVVTFPLVLNLNAGFVGASESDAYEYARHSWWYGYALANGLPVFSHPYLAYPDGLPGAWLWAIPLQSVPVWPLAAGLPLAVAYNLTALLRLALNGWATWFLVRRLLNGTHSGAPLTPYPGAAALVAGAVFTTYPAVQGHLFGSHLGIIALWGVPLYLDALLSLRRGGTAGRYGRAAVYFTLSVLGSSLNLIYVVFPLTLWVLGGALARREWAALGRSLAGVGVGFALAAVFVAPAALEQLTDPAAVRPGGVVRFSADLLAVVSPSFFSPGAPPWSAAVIGTNIVEGYGYIGVVAGLLAALGLWRTPAGRGLAWAALAAWVLSLGPVLKIFDAPVTLAVDGRATFVPLPFALLGNLPLLEITRTPGRFNLAVGLAVAVLAGYGAAVAFGWLRRAGVRWAAAGVLVLLIAADYQLAWGGFPTVPAAIPGEIAALRDDDTVRAVLNLPHDNLLVAKEAMYLQTAHHKPLIAGFVSRQTPVPAAKLETLQRTLDPALLEAAGADAVIVFREAAPELYDRALLALGEPTYSGTRYAVFRVPGPGAPPMFTASPSDASALQQPIDSHVYTPAPAWAQLTANLDGEARRVAVQLDGETVHSIYVNGPTRLRLPVPLTEGYHSVTLAGEPPCPRYSPSVSAICPAVTVDNLTLAEDVPFGLAAPVSFDGGITLREATVTLGADGAVSMRLWWAFDAPLDDTTVRFVQVVGPDGEQAAGSDVPLGPLLADTARVEWVTLPLPDDAPPGEYAVYTGWYTFPSLARLPVLTDIDGTPDGWARLATITRP